VKKKTEKETDFQLDKIFKEKGKRGYSPSIEVVGGILGCCWEKPAKNVEISKAMKRKKLKGSSEGNISEALSYLDNRGARIIKNDPAFMTRKNTVDFEGVIDFLFAYLLPSGTGDEQDEEQKSNILEQMTKNRQKTGEWFLKMFSNKDFLKFVHAKRHLKKHPEIFLYSILTSDLASMRSFGSSVKSYPSNGKEEDILRRIYAEQEDFLQKNYPSIEPDPDGKFKEKNLYPAKEFFEKFKEARERRKKEGKAPKVPEKRPVSEDFYADLMSSFKSTIVTKYEEEEEDESIRIFLNALDGIRQRVLF